MPRLSLPFRLLFWALALCLVAPEALRAEFDGDFEQKEAFLLEENFLDLAAYSRPTGWWRIKGLSPRYFEGTVGSLNLEDFYKETDLRLFASLGDWFHVGYSQSERSIWTAKPTQSQVRFSLGPSWNASLLGFPVADKRYGEIGYALGYGQPFEALHFEVSFLNQYLYYNEKNIPEDGSEPEESFIETPVTYRAAFQYLGDSFALSLEGKQDQPARLQATADTSEQTYQGGSGRARLELGAAEGFRLGFRYEGDLEERRLFDASGDAQKEQRIEYQWKEVYFVWPLGESWNLELVYLDQSFSNLIEAPATEDEFDFLLTTRQGILRLGPGPKESGWRLGWHHGLVERHRIDANETIEADETTQQKATLGYLIRGESAQLLFNGTFDGDGFAERPWDGGNVQLLMHF